MIDQLSELAAVSALYQLIRSQISPHHMESVSSQTVVTLFSDSSCLSCTVKTCHRSNMAPLPVGGHVDSCLFVFGAFSSHLYKSHTIVLAVSGVQLAEFHSDQLGL